MGMIALLVLDCEGIAFYKTRMGTAIAFYKNTTRTAISFYKNRIETAIALSPSELSLEPIQG